MTFKPVRETEEIPINSEERESGKVPRKGRGCSRWPRGGWSSPRRAPLMTTMAMGARTVQVQIVKHSTSVLAITAFLIWACSNS